MKHEDTVGQFAIQGHPAKVIYDQSQGCYYGWFTDLKGYADFYADSIDACVKEAEISLRVYLETCEDHGIDDVPRET